MMEQLNSSMLGTHEGDERNRALRITFNFRSLPDLQYLKSHVFSPLKEWYLYGVFDVDLLDCAALDRFFNRATLALLQGA